MTGSDGPGDREWASAFPHRPLAPGEVRVYGALLADLRPHRRQLAATLSPLERDRAGCFRQARDRLEFTLAHGFLRTVLGLHLRAQPGAPGLLAGCPGRPRPAGGELDCSLARTRGAAACALASGRAVGVDLEFLDHLPELQELVEAVLAPRERAAFDALPAGLRERAFLQLWVCKEAVLKLDGAGLQVPPRDLEVAPACWAGTGFRTQSASGPCRVRTFAFAGLFLGALAVRPDPAGVQLARFTGPGRP